MSEIPELGDSAHFGAAAPPAEGAATAEVAAEPYQGRFGAVRSLRRRAARGMIVNSLYQVALAALSMVRGLAAAALLTAGEYGVWGLLGLAMFTVVAMKAVGVNQKYVQQAEGDQELAFQRGFTIELIFSAISLPVIAAIVCAISLITGHPEVIPAGLVLTLIVVGLALQFPVWAYYRRMDFRRQRLLQGVDPVVATVVTIVLAALGLGYWSLVVGAVSGALVGGAVAIANSPYRLALRHDMGTVRQYVSFSGPMVVVAISGLAVFYAVYLTGNVAIGLAGLGAFTVVGNLVQFTNKADSVITETLYPALCAVQDRIEILYEAFLKSNRLALIWAAPFGIGLSLFATDLVEYVIGDQWISAIGLIELMGVVTAINHVGFNWVAFYRARSETRPIAVATVITAATTIAAAVPLMFATGITGLGWGYVIGAVAALSARGFYLMRLFPGFQPMRHMVRALLPTAVAAAALLALRAAGAGGESGASAIAELALFLAVVVTATWAFERGLLREALGYFSSRSRSSAASEGATAAAS
jgi:lipopolysaccharide exporter